MKKVCISVKNLYETLGDTIGINKITVTDNYYDMSTIEQGIVCMDGEVCSVVQETDFDVTLQNDNGEVTTLFVLTKDQLAISDLGYSIQL